MLSYFDGNLRCMLRLAVNAIIWCGDREQDLTPSIHSKSTPFVRGDWMEGSSLPRCWPSQSRNVLVHGVSPRRRSGTRHAGKHVLPLPFPRPTFPWPTLQVSAGGWDRATDPTQQTLFPKHTPTPRHSRENRTCFVLFPQQGSIDQRSRVFLPQPRGKN